MSRSSWKYRVMPMQTAVLLFAATLSLPLAAYAESCTTQSQMSNADRTGLAAAAQSFATRVQANDAAGIKTVTIPQYAQNFDGIASSIGSTAPRLAGATLSITSLYILDATTTGGAAATEATDTQFFCTLNSSGSDVIFSIPALLPGRYALATVHAQTQQAAWQLSFVLQQHRDAKGSAWLLAGFIPKPATAAGHDGLWYWTQARTYAKQAQRWNAWLYYTEADALLTPVDFVSSSNRDKLHAEQESSMPPALVAHGISSDHPLPLQSFAFTAMGTQSTPDGKLLELAVHVVASDVSNPVAVRERSAQALAALLTAYPELRTAFPAAWVYADAPGQSSFGIEFNPLPGQ